MVLPQLRRIRWAVRATLLLGVAASVLANILHASHNPISQAIAAWPPIALLLTIELISRVPVHRRLLAAGRLVATAIIAGIAAWVSYWHMAGVAARYGETGASPYLLPLSVDGLIVVASICLVELGGRIAALQHPRAAAEATASHIMVDAVPAESAQSSPVPALVPAPAGARAAAQPASTPAAAPRTEPPHAIPPVSAPAVTPRTATPQPASAAATAIPQPANAPRTAIPQPASAAATAPRIETPAAHAAPRAELDHTPVPTGASPVRRSTAAALAEVAAALPRSTPPEPGFSPAVTRSGAGIAPRLGAPTGRPAAAQRRTASAGRGGSSGNSGAIHSGKRTPAARSRRSPAETVALAARIKAERPTLTEAELAAELGISPSRWRTVRREAAQSANRSLAA